MHGALAKAEPSGCCDDAGALGRLRTHLALEAWARHGDRRPSRAIQKSPLKTAPRSRGPNKGAEIRAKIAANRAKRHRIADAMKREAGVTEHTVIITRKISPGLRTSARERFTHQKAERLFSSIRWLTN